MLKIGNRPIVVICRAGNTGEAAALPAPQVQGGRQDQARHPCQRDSRQQAGHLYSVKSFCNCLSRKYCIYGLYYRVHSLLHCPVGSMLLIRIQIGSVFSSFFDPDTYFDDGSGSTSTSTQV